MALHDFHPAVSRWFSDRLGEPTAAQRRGWDAIRAGRDALIAAPTGSGKTLAAFLISIDQLLRESLSGTLPEETRVALRLAAQGAESRTSTGTLPSPGARSGDCRRDGLRRAAITAAVRSGDTPAAERAAMLKSPPHILVTTPESLYLLLTAERSREMLRTVRTVIVDEIHAVARDKRGSAPGAEPRAPRRMLPAAAAADRPLGHACDRSKRSRDCSSARRRRRRASRSSTRDIAAPSTWRSSCPASPLEAVCRTSTGTRSTTGSPSSSTRIARRSSSSTPAGSPSGSRGIWPSASARTRSRRTTAASRRRAGSTRRRASRTASSQALVATASLELGHRHRPRGSGLPDRLPAAHRDASSSASAARATRCAACRRAASSRSRATSWSSARRCVREVAGARSDRTILEHRSTSWRSRSWPSRRPRIGEDDLFALFRRPIPIGTSSAPGFDAGRDARGGLQHGAAGAAARCSTATRSTSGSAAGAGARLPAITSGGAIPDTADYRVCWSPRAPSSARVNEDFAIESLAGDIFQLGNLPGGSCGFSGHRAGRGRPGPAPDHSLLARRGACTER